MKDESLHASKNQAHQNGIKKIGLFNESDDDEDQVMETDEFGKLHRELCKKTKKDIEGERA